MKTGKSEHGEADFLKHCLPEGPKGGAVMVKGTGRYGSPFEIVANYSGSLIISQRAISMGSEKRSSADATSDCR